ncbi:MAG TPA: 4Fe-4S binding protein, partial [Gammaproteobacteria bacterium]|nr:4Fe-4S binding protein [Gammaproteobacteria bacterium]
MTAKTMGQLTFSTVEADAGLKAALAKSRADVIGEVSKSGLKGRGGAGFPTGVKWNLAAAATSSEKYIVCNADEGEPGTFKDRVILTDFADIVFEGMTIAAYAIGAMKGILYLRGEYTYLRKPLEDCLKQRRENNLLGEKVLGKDGFDFDIEIRLGSGAYICGEETALIESLEGQRGEPRNVKRQAGNTGDCIDCGICVQVCPTGIDIRDGLQYQCINCGLCIDACDQV